VVVVVDTRGVNGKDKGVGRGWIWWNPVQVLIGDNSILLGWQLAPAKEDFLFLFLLWR
jgi:hypothetical protein